MGCWGAKRKIIKRLEGERSITAHTLASAALVLGDRTPRTTAEGGGAGGDGDAGLLAPSHIKTSPAPAPAFSGTAPCRSGNMAGRPLAALADQAPHRQAPALALPSSFSWALPSPSLRHCVRVRVRVRATGHSWPSSSARAHICGRRPDPPPFSSSPRPCPSPHRPSPSAPHRPSIRALPPTDDRRGARQSIRTYVPPAAQGKRSERAACVRKIRVRWTPSFRRHGRVRPPSEASFLRAQPRLHICRYLRPRRSWQIAQIPRWPVRRRSPSEPSERTLSRIYARARIPNPSSSPSVRARLSTRACRAPALYLLGPRAPSPRTALPAPICASLHPIILPSPPPSQLAGTPGPWTPPRGPQRNLRSSSKENSE